MSEFMMVTLLAWAAHKLASSNNETIADSVASWRAWRAADWNRNFSVSKFNSLRMDLTIYRWEWYFCAGMGLSASTDQCSSGISWSLSWLLSLVWIYVSSWLRYRQGHFFWRSSDLIASYPVPFFISCSWQLLWLWASFYIYNLFINIKYNITL